MTEAMKFAEFWMVVVLGRNFRFVRPILPLSSTDSTYSGLNAETSKLSKQGRKELASTVLQHGIERSQSCALQSIGAYV